MYLTILLFQNTIEVPPQIETAPAVCPLGNEYPVAAGIASAKGFILLSNSQGRYIQAVVFKNVFAIKPNI